MTGDIRTLTLSEFTKLHAEPDESQMLLAKRSRYEDAFGRRCYIDPELPELTIVASRGKVRSLHAPSAASFTAGIVDEYAGGPRGGLVFLRPPLILPSSVAPWAVLPGHTYRLASGVESTPVPKKAAKSRQVLFDWMIENSHRPEFIDTLPDSLPAKQATNSDLDDLNIRLWNDMRGPGLERQREIQILAMRRMAKGQALDPIEHLLPENREDLMGSIPNAVPDDINRTWRGREEATWTAMLYDPDVKRFAPDRDASVDFDTTHNLFLEADNLLALKAIHAGYRSKVKLTYIDPPYNTGQKFVYSDDFTSKSWEGSPFIGQRWGDGTWRILQRALPTIDWGQA